MKTIRPPHPRDARHRRRCRGIFITDAVVGLSILAALITIAAITLGHDQRATRAATEHRQLTATAEEALLALRLGQTPETPELPVELILEQVTMDDAPPGKAWVRATASRGGQSVSLLTLAPVDALPAPQPGGDE
ncbi:hypothetical protein OT109_01515 [Phycisphaeraceae bacterium D3-23]